MANNKNLFNLPNHIKIGYADYDVKTFRNKKDDDNPLGETHHQQHLFRINEDQNMSECVSTMLHEIAHAMCYVFNINFKNIEEEEKYVAAFANGYATIYKDNPEILDWIKSSLNEGNKTAYELEVESRAKKTIRRTNKKKK